VQDPVRNQVTRDRSKIYLLVADNEIS